jgi:asparagine synthase (glutamine-hydrolysing)
MSAFAGIVSLSASPIDPRLLDRAAAALSSSRKGRTVTRPFKSAAFVERMPSGEGRSPATENHRGPFAAVARLDNREELGEALGIAHNELAPTSDAALLQRLFERRGEAGVARCVGAFAFAHWESATRRLTLGRDCLGNRPLFYHHGREFVCFATTLGALFALPDVPRAIDEIALANFIAINFNDGRQTFYRGIERVTSRSLVTIDSLGVHHRPYWAPNLETPPPYRRDEDYIERGRELFDLAVAAATRDTPRVAISTSGGFDSSAIAATAARQAIASSITCLCIAPPANTEFDIGPRRYFDERDKVNDLARMYPRLDIRFITSGGSRSRAAEDVRYFAGGHLPALNSNIGSAQDFTDAVMATGSRTLLIGLQGDFGLTWSGPLALLELLRAGRWATFLRDLHATARDTNRSLPRTFASNIILPAAPAGLRRLVYRLCGRDPDSVAAHSALNPCFVADAGLARQWQAQRFDPWFGLCDSNPRRWRAHRLFDFNQYGRDVRGLHDEIFGHDVRDPHSDRRLLEFALAVPEPMYCRNGVQRWFARQVFADRLPQSILAERRRGANNPTWFRSLSLGRDELAADVERLETSKLAKQLLDLPRLKRLLAEWPKSANEAETRQKEYRAALSRGVHVGRFIRWVEGGNA